MSLQVPLLMLQSSASPLAVILSVLSQSVKPLLLCPIWKSGYGAGERKAPSGADLEMPRIELGASYMRSMRSSTELHPPAAAGKGTTGAYVDAGQRDRERQREREREREREPVLVYQ